MFRIYCPPGSDDATGDEKSTPVVLRQRVAAALINGSIL